MWLFIHVLIISSIWYAFWTDQSMVGELTHRGRDKMATIIQTTFSNAFSWMKIYEFLLKFYWSPKGPVNSIPTLVQIKACHWSGDKPFSEPMMAWFTDAYMRHSVSMSNVDDKASFV